MGFYLNSRAAYTLYRNESKKPYFVDKSHILEELFPLVSEGNNYICLTRPRRFGKTIMANMIVSFFSKACDSKVLFDQLAVSGAEGYESSRNKYDVVHVSFNDVPRECSSYGQYIRRIENRLGRDLANEFPDVEFDPEDAICQIKEKNYPARFSGKNRWDGNPRKILLVGIGYDRQKKKHRCKVEWMENQEAVFPVL